MIEALLSSYPLKIVYSFLFPSSEIKIFVSPKFFELIKSDLIFSIVLEKVSFLISIKVKEAKIGNIIKNRFFNSIYSLIIINSFFDFK